MLHMNLGWSVAPVDLFLYLIQKETSGGGGIIYEELL